MLLKISIMVWACLGLIMEAALAAGASHRVVVKAAAYDPEQVKAHVGDVVEWENQDIVAHTATASDKSWDVSIMPGQSGRVVVKTPGTFSYICRYHPNMKGELLVEP